MHNIVYSSINVQNIGAAVAVDIAVVTSRFDLVKEVLDVVLLFLGRVLFFRRTHHNRRTIFTLEALLIETARGVIFHLVNTEHVATSQFIATGVFIFELCDMHSGLGALDFFKKHVDTLVLAVQIEFKELEAGTVAPRSLVKPVCQRVTNKSLVHIRAMKHPVRILGHAENLKARVLPRRIMKLYAVALLRKVRRSLPANLDADINFIDLRRIRKRIRAVIHNAHFTGNLVGTFRKILAFRIHDNQRQVICLRKSNACEKQRCCTE